MADHTRFNPSCSDNTCGTVEEALNAMLDDSRQIWQVKELPDQPMPRRRVPGIFSPAPCVIRSKIIARMTIPIPPTKA